MNLRALTTSADSTRALAAAVAELVTAGDVIVLAGELGAGKTAFAQGLGVALGVTEQITSPTFTLARHYEGRLAMHHLDVYRVERIAELADLGVAELLDSGGVVVVEWGDAIAPSLGGEYLEIRLSYGDGDDDRHLDVRCVGTRWGARRRSLAEALTPWTDGAS